MVDPVANCVTAPPAETVPTAIGESRRTSLTSARRECCLRSAECNSRLGPTRPPDRAATSRECFPPRLDLVSPPERSRIAICSFHRATRGDKTFPSVRPPHACAGLQPVLERLPGLNHVRMGG